MKAKSTHSLALRAGAAPPLAPAGSAGEAPESPAARAAAAQKAGKRMIYAGFVVTIVGVVLYCIACFAGDPSADLGDILIGDAVPMARTTLGVLGVGTLLWLVGSLRYLRGAMDADEEGAGDDAPRRASQDEP